MTHLAHRLPTHVVPAPAGAVDSLRVCHVMSADLWAGAEIQVATVASYLVERPEVSVVAVLLNEGALASELRRLGLPVTVIDEREHGSLAILLLLTRFLRENDIDIVHTHRYKDNVLGSVAAKLAGVPHVVRTVHGLNEAMRGWSRAKLGAYAALDKTVLWYFVDRILAVSGRIAETLRQAGHRSTSIVAIHNGIDLRKVTPARSREAVRRELGVGPDTLVIGTVGRLSPVKGHIHLLEAARLILRQEPGARFLLVGDGPLGAELKTSARRLGIDRACDFVGSRADVYDLVAAMDIFVLPSLDEGVPMALLEAMALERPVVASAVGGVPEVVTQRTTGVLVQPRDPQAMADACLDLAAHPDWAQALGRRARQVVQDRFSHETNGRAVMNVYRDVSAGRASDAARGGRRVASIRPSGAPVMGQPTAAEILARVGRGLLQYGHRRLQRAVARRSMARIRKNPAALRAALGSAKTLLIACQGNIIRSPFAARLIARQLGRHTSISILSGGLEAIPGRPAHPTAVLLAAARHIDLQPHAATRLAPEIVARADVILVMDVGQLLVMWRRFPEARAKTFLLTCLAPDVPLEVPDPYDGDHSQFLACFDQICRTAQPIVRALSNAGGTCPSADRVSQPA
jgi:L-malate glycosyltransferase